MNQQNHDSRRSHRFPPNTFLEHSFQVSRGHPPRSNQPFRPLPEPTGPPPYHLSLEQVLPAEHIQDINNSKRLVFHVVGDTGGVKAPQPQQIVAIQMAYDFKSSDLATHPSFFYHLGDVVYYFGEADQYYPQFYEPYEHYPAPIFAIPGNHDGDLPPPDQEAPVPSLAAFVENFCSPTARLTKEAQDVQRVAMTQPNVYWTLEAPFLTIIGLYTNVPEGGQLEGDQITWLESELATAPTDKALVIATHHPPYSLERYHGGSAYMRQILDQAIDNTGRIPDMVLAGHVHNYQRFTRTRGSHQVPYIVAGAGGYWHLHHLIEMNGQPIQTPFPVPDEDVTLESYCDDRHGYMRVEVTPERLIGSYFAVPHPQDSWHTPYNSGQPIDTFTLDLKQHQLVHPALARPRNE